MTGQPVSRVPLPACTCLGGSGPFAPFPGLWDHRLSCARRVEAARRERTKKRTKKRRLPPLSSALEPRLGDHGQPGSLPEQTGDPA